jgi:hypothetical protein
MGQGHNQFVLDIEKMNHLPCTKENIALVLSLFRLYPKIFTHVKPAYIEECLKKTRCIYEDQVLIIYTIYKRQNRIGNYVAQRDFVTINQLVSKEPGKGNATTVMQRFLSWIGKTVCLSVRTDNVKAVAFYRKLGFKECGVTSWKNGTVPGIVFEHCCSATI